MLAASVALAGVPVAAGIRALVVTPGLLETSWHAFGAPGATAPRLRIVQVSDLHLRSFGPVERKVIDTISAARPDMIVLTGDMVESSRGLGPLREFLDSCPRVKSFAIPGNWEYSSGVPMHEFARLCHRVGIEWLVNRSIVVPHAGTTVRITGLDDLQGGRPDADRALANAESVPHHLVLAHCPASRDRIAMPSRHTATLMLSGHTHGGQVAPLGVALVLPPGSGGYVSGWYGRHDGSSRPPLYVSRGIGTSVVPVRLGALPELAVFDWALA